MLNETKIIDYLQAKFPNQIGDDAAVLPFSVDESYVVTKDLLVQDIHFRLAYSSPASLAHKALHANLSDVAAMGAKPQFVLLGLSIPESYEDYIDKFLQGFSQACKDSGVILIGGDTTKSPNKLFISITAIGIVPNQNLKYRHTALKGDSICIAGNLGNAHVGFTALETSQEGFESFKTAFLKPKALLEEGYWFGKQHAVTAMMDLSDGLFIDLKKLCKTSKVAAEINLNNLQVTEEFNVACDILKLDPMITQLIGGEDYGLLLTVRAEQYFTLASQFKADFGYDLMLIGHITKGVGARFNQNGFPKNLQLQPFSHFGELL